MKRYYAKYSAHGSASSYGFSNDTVVLCFDNQADRDTFVAESDNLSCEAIKAKDATKYATNWIMQENRDRKPQPFSEEYWGIVPEFCPEHETPGLLGEVDIVTDDNWRIDQPMRVYK